MHAPARLRVVEERTGLSLLGACTLVAIISVLVLVSLPRLRGFATTANEEDAVVTSLRLAGALADRSVLPQTLPPVEQVARDHLRELTDAEFFVEGARMRRHGYLFELRCVPRPTRTGLGRVVYANDPSPIPAVVAWPWAVGRTGTTALVATLDGDVFVHRNEDGAWTGPESPPPSATPAGRWSWQDWRPMRRGY